MATTERTRLAREAGFWDVAHTEGIRGPAQRWYALREGREALYRRWCLEVARGANKRALELGVCLGGAGFSLAHSGTEVEAIDISPATVAVSAASAAEFGLGDRLTFKVMNAEELEYEDESFDLVCGTAIIHHLDLERALPEVNRVLRPGGWAIFTEPLGHNPLINAYRGRTPTMRTPDEHPLTMDDLAGLWDHFTRVEAEYFHLASLAAVPLAGTRFFAPARRALEWVDRALFHFPSARGWAWYVVVRAQKAHGY
jgi:SAM-dependent methyltransferase